MTNVPHCRGRGQEIHAGAGRGARTEHGAATRRSPEKPRGLTQAEAYLLEGNLGRRKMKSLAKKIEAEDIVMDWYLPMHLCFLFIHICCPSLE